MASSRSIDDFKRWKVDALRKYCQQRRFTTTGTKRKDELVALAYTAYSKNVPVVPTKDDEKAAASRQYVDLLTLDDGSVFQIRSVLGTMSGPLKLLECNTGRRV